MKKSFLDDPKSFLYPCLGFDLEQELETYLTNSTSPAPLDRDRVFRTQIKSYVLNCAPDQFNTALATQFHEGRAVWQVLRHRQHRRPAGAYNTCLMVAGPGEVLIKDSLLPCFTEWSKLDGRPIKPIPFSKERVVYAQRYGLGIVFIELENQDPADSSFVMEFCVVDPRFPELYTRDDMIKITPRKNYPRSLFDRARAGYEKHFGHP